MSDYIAPLRDMLFVLREVAPLDRLSALPGFEEVNLDLATAILEEAGKFASGVLSPLNVSGDREGARWHEGEVRTASGWREAYRRFVEGGWNALSCDAAHGGQGLPRLVSALVEEMWNGASVSFALCPMLTRGAIEALELRGCAAQKAMYLPKLVTGTWTGTMNLTEPQAGSDLAAVRTKALPQPDGSYRLHGQKIFITYGEHDLSENIVHLVLARTPRTRPRASRASRCLSCRSSSSTTMAASAGATTCAACPSSTSWAFMPVPPQYWRSATTRGRSAGWSEKRTAGSKRCSS